MNEQETVDSKNIAKIINDFILLLKRSDVIIYNYFLYFK